MPRFRVKVMDGKIVLGEGVFEASNDRGALQQALLEVRKRGVTNRYGGTIGLADLVVEEFEEPEEEPGQTLALKPMRPSLQSDRRETRAEEHIRTSGGETRDQRFLREKAEAKARVDKAEAKVIDIRRGLAEAAARRKAARKFDLQEQAEALLDMFLSSARERAEAGIGRKRALTQAAEAAHSYVAMVGPEVAQGLYDAFVAAFDEASEE